MDINDINESYYAQHKISVNNSIQRIIEDDPDTYTDEFRAFNYLVFDLFSDTPPETFVLTDGAYDQGIDFYTKSDGSYEIFQCKFASLEDILKSDKPLSFDQKSVNDLENAYKYLTGSVVPDTANNLVKKLRAQIVSEGYDNISFNLCTFGYLTEDAEQKFNKLKQHYESGSDKFSFQINTWKDIILYIVRKTSPITSNSHKFRIHGVGWKKRTPKSGKINRRRCQHERDPARKIHMGVPPGSGETDHRGEAIFSGGRASVVPGPLDTQLLGQGL